MTFLLSAREGFGGYIAEVSNSWTRLVPKALTEADVLNGLQYHGYAVMGGSAYRFYAQSLWGEWKNFVVPFEADHVDRYEWTTIIIEKRNDKWSFTPYQLGGAFDPDSIAANKPSCAVLTTMHDRW